MKIKIEYINFGVAFRINNTIYLHKNLKSYPKLCNQLIKHELDHTDSFKLQDIKNDLKGNHLSSVKKEYWKFVFTQPKAFYQFLPIMKIKNSWTIDPIMSVVWLVSIVWICVLLKIM